MAELHSIRLFGSPCPIKKPTHNIKSKRFNPTVMVFKRFFISDDWDFRRQNWQHKVTAKDLLDKVDHSYDTKNVIVLGGS
jgi:hypothetical protein